MSQCVIQDFLLQYCRDQITRIRQILHLYTTKNILYPFYIPFSRKIYELLQNMVTTEINYFLFKVLNPYKKSIVPICLDCVAIDNRRIDVN